MDGEREGERRMSDTDRQIYMSSIAAVAARSLLVGSVSV